MNRPKPRIRTLIDQALVLACSVGITGVFAYVVIATGGIQRGTESSQTWIFFAVLSSVLLILIRHIRPAAIYETKPRDRASRFARYFGGTNILVALSFAAYANMGWWVFLLAYVVFVAYVVCDEPIEMELAHQRAKRWRRQDDDLNNKATSEQ